MTQPTNRRRRASWRVVDIVVVAVLAAVCAVVFWAWSNLLYPVVSTTAVAYPPAAGLLGGGWLIAGPLGALIIRKPGAALFCELLAAVLEGFLGTHFGWTVVVSGLVQGLGAELAFFLTGYRRYGVGIAVAAGALSGLAMGLGENVMYNFEWAVDQRAVYAVLTTISGAVIAGAGTWLVTRALRSTGVLGALASGSVRR